MPLGGPRPNPSPSRLSSTYDPAPGFLPVVRDATSTPSSQLSYPHQSISDSETIRSEPPPFGAHDSYGLRDTLLEGDIGIDFAPGRGHTGPSPIGLSDPYAQQMQQQMPPYHTAFPQPQPKLQPSAAASAKQVPTQPSYADLSYTDDEGAYYRSEAKRPTSMMENDDVEMRGLVQGAAEMGEGDQEPYRSFKFAEYDTSPYPYPSSQKGSSQMTPPSHLQSWLLFPTGLDRLMALFGMELGRYPVEQAVERKKRGLSGQKWPVAAWSLAVVISGVMVYELVANHNAMGSPIAIHPNFNYMIGPSSEVLINIGARFPPCMKYVAALPPTFELACLNDTSNVPASTCPIEEICGHGGFHGQTPDQAWRFVSPIFLHVGIIHLAVNMIAQVIAGAQVEREMGTVPFLLVYFAGGIYGFILGGNFSRTGIPSVGASGALFATNACMLVDLLLHWKYEERPRLKAFLLILEFLVGIAIGYIPNAVDGLAHLGGFSMGLLMGTILYPSISETKRHRYIVWGCRVVALPLIIMAFVLTIRNFYTANPNAACEWCRYLSCIPTAANDHCSGTGIITTNVTTTRRSWDSL